MTDQPDRPTASIIVPAHNESGLIRRCLQSILADSDQGEFDVIVACNGCTDDTADVARDFDPPVRVIDIAPADKSAALNAGDREARAFPRLYVDADVIVDTDSVRAVINELESPSVLAAAPRLTVDTAGSSWPVRAYYRVWTRLPWATEALLGSGFYALSESGRGRFSSFPNIRADDYWVSAQFSPSERTSVEGSSFTIAAARDLPTLIRRKARILAYNRIADAYMADAEVQAEHQGSTGSALLRLVRSEPHLLPAAALYSAVAVASKLLATRKLRRDELEWVSDR